MRTLCLALILILGLQDLMVIYSSAQIADKTCIILNNEFKEYYLYASANKPIIKSAQRSVGLRKSPFTSKSPENFTSDEKQGVWNLKYIENTLSSYYIKNLEFDEYLFANQMNALESLLTQERTIKTDKEKSLEDLDEKYMWNFKKVYDGVYEIWNVKFNERTYFFCES
jgi:hypothetical protein